MLVERVLRLIPLFVPSKYSEYHLYASRCQHLDSHNRALVQHWNANAIPKYAVETDQDFVRTIQSYKYQQKLMIFFVLKVQYCQSYPTLLPHWPHRISPNLQQKEECQSVQPVLMMRWTPLSVDITSLISPTFSPYVASSKGFCIIPTPNQPRSPLLAWEEQSECLLARAANCSGEPLISDWYPRRISIASSFVRVILACEQEVRGKEERRKISTHKKC
jgi:hypothetical protein